MPIKMHYVEKHVLDKFPGETGNFAIYDRKTNTWLGEEDGVVCWPKMELADLAARFANTRNRESRRFQARVYNDDANKYAGEEVWKHSTESTMRRLGVGAGVQL